MLLNHQTALWTALATLCALGMALPTVPIPTHTLDLTLLESMPDDVVRGILQDTWAAGPADLQQMTRSGPRGRDFAARFNYSHFSNIGSIRNIVRDPTLCHQLAQANDKLVTVRDLHINWHVYNRCQLNPQNLVNLERLVVKLAEPQPIQVPPVVAPNATPLQPVAEDDLGDVSPIDVRRQVANALLRGISVASDDFVNVPEENDVEAQPNNIYDLWLRLHAQYPKLKYLEVLDEDNNGVLHYLIAKSGIEDRMNKIQDVLRSSLVNVNWENSYKHTPLHHCMMPELFLLPSTQIIGAYECVTALLAAGADTNTFTVRGHSPMHLAAALNDKAPLEAMLNAGGLVDAMQMEQATDQTQVNGATPLRFAIQSEALIGRFTTIDVQERFAFYPGDPVYTLLQENVNTAIDAHTRASARKALPSFLLVQRGADLGAVHRSDTVLVYALSHPLDDLITEILNLPDERIPVHKFEPMRATPLHAAVARNNVQFVERLLNLGADVNAVAYGNLTPLLHGIMQGIEFPVYDLLVQRGADLNHRTEHGYTPLLAVSMYNVNNDRNRMAVDLIRRGADLSVNPMMGTPEQHSSAMGYLLLHHFNPVVVGNEARDLLRAMIESLSEHGGQDRAGGLDDVDYHLLITATHELDDGELMNMLRARLPEKIKAQFTDAMIDQQGLIPSEAGVNALVQIYGQLAIVEPHFLTKTLVYARNSRLYLMLRSIMTRPQFMQLHMLGLNEQVRNVQLIVGEEGGDIDEGDVQQNWVQQFRAKFPSARVRVEDDIED